MKRATQRHEFEEETDFVSVADVNRVFQEIRSTIEKRKNLEYHTDAEDYLDEIQEILVRENVWWSL